LASPPSATGSGDPHIVGAHGDRFDFKGEDGVAYALLSARDLAVNGRFKHDVYTLGSKEVHGSFITEAYLTARTASGEIVRLSYNASAPSVAELLVGPRKLTLAISSLAVNEVGLDQFTQDTLDVKLQKNHMNDASLVVSDGAWVVTCSTRLYPYSTDNKMKTRLDLSFTPAKGAAKSLVAPHGLIGQTFDRDQIAVDGAQDDYSGNVVVTKAMGEGAIEGAASDYALPLQDPYSPAFKYSRFNTVAAPPRDVSKLAGIKRKGSESASASATNDDADA